ncbi:MAG: (2Fe-2S)-binding protein [Candidatus Stahlbacteria bacterium]|nr:(2Fe-2S)-binding protein [Candidatus Stahlbacteria bacterium]
MKITITIDWKTAKTERRTPIIKVAEELGIKIPTLCYNEQLEPYGVCRLCTVEVVKGKRTRFVTACNYPVEEGLTIYTHSEKVMQIRRLIIESLLALCPDVKILQSLAKELGVKELRFEKGKEDCIKCGLCVRMCEEIVGLSAISFADRGVDRKVITPFDLPSDICIGCGACSFVCPTKSIKMELKAGDRFRSLPGNERFCRYAIMGIIPNALCANSFRCWKCEVDQRFIEQLNTHPIFLSKKRKTKEVKDYITFLHKIRR